MKPIIAMIPAASLTRRPACLEPMRSQHAAAAVLILLRVVSLRVLVLLHIVSCIASPLAAQTPADIARVARDLPQSLDLQTQMPVRKQNEDWRLDSDIVRVVVWTVVAAGTGVLLYCLYEVLPAFSTRRRPQWENAAGGDAAAAGGGEAAARAAADELAAQGRFVEAMHVLLLQGLDEMRMHLDLRFADSLTSREIVSRAHAPAGAKAALRDIIQWVEHAYFGDHPVDRNDYDACRRSYLTLDGILRTGGRP
jgi:hypothetical protein